MERCNSVIERLGYFHPFRFKIVFFCFFFVFFLGGGKGRGLYKHWGSSRMAFLLKLQTMVCHHGVSAVSSGGAVALSASVLRRSRKTSFAARTRNQQVGKGSQVR